MASMDTEVGCAGICRASTCEHDDAFFHSYNCSVLSQFHGVVVVSLMRRIVVERSEFERMVCAVEWRKHNRIDIALVDCPDSGAKVSENAATCVHCGAPSKAATHSYYDGLIPNPPETRRLGRHCHRGGNQD